jgi:hypothetical protein
MVKERAWLSGSGKRREAKEAGMKAIRQEF